MFATEKQIAFIVSLAKARGMTKTEALADYGINPGQTLTLSLASQVINHLKGLTVTEAMEQEAAYRASRQVIASTPVSLVGRRVYTSRGYGIAVEEIKKAVVVTLDNGTTIKMARTTVETV